MSIINQTLRALDARQPERVAPRAPLEPPAIGTRRNARLWGVAAALLPIAGLAIWFISRPAAESMPQPREVATQHAVLPPAEKPATPAPPAVTAAVSAAQPPAKVETPSIVVEKQPGSTDSNAGEQRQATASPSKLPVQRETTDLPGQAVAQQPAIRKEISQPTVREEADERYRKALVLIRAGQSDQARALLEAALALSPGHVTAREALAALLSDAGRNQEAEQVLGVGRATNPEHAWFALSLARLQAARGDMGSAVASLKGGLEGRGVGADYHATLAALLVRLKQYPEAVQQYEQALKKQSGQGTWWMGLGLALDAQGKNDEARSAYRRALAAGNLPDPLAEFTRTKLAD